MSAEFVHLHVHSEYSLLDGLPHPAELAQRAKELNQRALAITDHGTMFAAIEFHDACRQSGVKPIVGLEAYLAPRGRKDRDPKLDRNAYHLLLLAENGTGYSNLMRLATAAQLEGFYYNPRVDKEILAKHAEGILATTGCLAAEIPQLILAGRTDAAREAMAWYREVFRDRFYIELQDHGIPELKGINQELVALAREFGLPRVATNDVHYLKADDWFAQDILICIQTGTTVTATDRMKMAGRDYYFKSSEEMASLWSDYPDALANTLEVAERCTLDLSSKGYHLPYFPVPTGFTPQSYLRALCEQGLAERYGESPSREVRERFEYELGVIRQMGFDTYFLIVWDLTHYARKTGIWYNVRGSAASSIVAYSLGITNLDPLQHHLIFERFLNPGRISMPDIDLDFPDDAREAMIRYTVEKYGRENVAQIITFGKLLAKAAIRDVGRALDYPLTEVDRVAKLIPVGPGQTIEGALERIPEFRELCDSSDYIKKLVDNAKLLEGVARHASTHAAGVVVADKPIVDYTPLHRATRGNDTGFPVTQYPMGDLEHIGLLKIDFLGLATLTIMRRACELIERRHGAHYDLSNIPVEDDEAFKLLSRGDVTGVFQVEGGGMRRVLTQMKPSKFDHIVAAISLYRPGPMDYIPKYIARMHGEEKITYAHPKLEPILGETYGVCISGDAIVLDARTGQPFRMDQIGNKGGLYLQGVDENLNIEVGRVSHWVHNGRKPVWEASLRNGAHIKMTGDHRLLTELGWRPLADLKVGDYIATPPELVAQEETSDRRKLRVLAYLLADGDLGNLASVNFVSKDPSLLNAYEECLTAFDNVTPTRLMQVHGVTRVTVAKGDREYFHAPNQLLAWLRELGLKNPPRSKPGGARSSEKFVPDFVFSLNREEIAYFLASLWDCDGYAGRKFWHYKTISQRLTQDVQTLLLKLGIPSKVYSARYVTTRGPRVSYQITVYDTARLSEWIHPYLLTAKRHQRGSACAETTLARVPFIAELEGVSRLSKRALMNQFGIDRQHFHSRGLQRERISSRVVASLAEQLKLTETQRKLRVRWEEIISIKPAGVEEVYDVTVEGLHNFVANNIIVHNCVYQEQILRIAMDCCGYSGPEADLLRKAVGKKQKEELLAQRERFVKGALEHGGIPEQVGNKLFDDLEFFARYGFNKAHAADYAVLTCQTAYLKAHYPLEYTCALLQNEIGNLDKIAVLVAEARRMGIPILPPDVRYSDVGFVIDEEQKGIHFGLSAIKNVGAGAVEVIANSRRAGGPFASLDEFCRRVDLRQVNRRVLESLIKAGALSGFGHREQLLKVIDRMLAVSASAHHASALGQMSFFGTALQADTFTQLPTVPEMDNREKLELEKELMGVYFSEHPLLKLAQLGKQSVTAYVGELNEEMERQEVTLGGVIGGVRVINTKKGAPMAFFQLEDPQGSIEVTAFPRVYAEARELIRDEALVLVKGKLQVRESKVTILADSVKKYPLPDMNGGNTRVGEEVKGRVTKEGLSTTSPDGVKDPTPSGPAPVPFAPDVEQEDLYVSDDWVPPPEEFESGPAVDLRLDSATDALLTGAGGRDEAEVPPPLPSLNLNAGIAIPSKTNGGNRSEGGAAQDVEPPRGNGGAQTARDPVPTYAARGAGRLVRVRIQRSHDADEDIRRMRDLVRVFRSAEGRDRFSLIVPNVNGNVQLDFPNYYTNYDSLAKQLREMIADWGELEVQ